MASVLHKELEYKVEKLKVQEVLGHAAEDQNQIRTSSLKNKPSQINPHEDLRSWLINTVYHFLLVKNNIRGEEGGGGGGY